MIDWTDDYRAKFQHRLRYEGHLAVCGLAGKYYAMPDSIEYPNVTKAYAPIDECAARNLPGSGTRFSLSIYAFTLVVFIVMLIWN